MPITLTDDEMIARMDEGDQLAPTALSDDRDNEP